MFSSILPSEKRDNIKESEQRIEEKTQMEEFKKENNNQEELKVTQNNKQIAKGKDFITSIPFDPNNQTFSRYKKEINLEEDQKKRAQREFIQKELKKQIEEKEVQKKAQKEKEKLEQIKKEERVHKEIQKVKENYEKKRKNEGYRRCKHFYLQNNQISNNK